MSIFNNRHVSFFLVIIATITLVSSQHLRGLSSSSWTPATWEYNGDKHTDPAWNLCNGLGKKCDMVSGVAGIPNCNEEGNIPKGALDLPCDACEKACTLNGAHGGLSNWNGNCDIPSKETIEAAEKAWMVGGTYPFIKDGPEDTGTIAAYCEDKTTADRKLGVLQAMQYVCIPNPDAISENLKITATIGIGHALGECGSLWLFKKDDSSSSNDDIIVQLQVDTRSWSFESSAINTLWPNENSKGCDVPLSQPVKWDCPANAKGTCELPIGWTEGACASYESPEGWSVPVNNISFNSDTYSAVATCTTCAPNGIPLDPKPTDGSTPIDGCCDGALCGVCTNDAWAPTPINVPGFINGLEQICHGLQDEISVGHGMFDGHECGECVCIKCNSQSKGGCKSDTPFLHMRQDDAYGSSNEVTTSFYNARWSAGGEQAVSFYEYKMVSSCDITSCE